MAEFVDIETWLRLRRLNGGSSKPPKLPTLPTSNHSPTRPTRTRLEELMELENSVRHLFSLNLQIARQHAQEHGIPDQVSAAAKRGNYLTF